MPGKSRRRRAKYSSQSKRKKGSLNRPAVVVGQQAVAHTREPVPLSKVPATPAGSPTVAKAAVIHHRYIGTELRTIGILAGIMLIILIVLSLVLS